MTIFLTRIFIALSLLFLSSCVTSKKERELIKVTEDDPANIVVKLIQESCFQAKHPQFLADFNSENSLMPAFEMEGIWENNYNILKASVIGPLGEEFLSLDIKGNELNYNNQSKILTTNESFEKITYLLSSLGAKGLRGFLCGKYAFENVNKNDGIFIIKEKSNVDLIPEASAKTEISTQNELLNKKYFSISTIEISGHNIEVQSSVFLAKKGNGYSVIVNSRFYYGIFSNDAEIEVKWVGFVNSTNVFPTTTIFRTKEETFGINFSEYQ